MALVAEVEGDWPVAAADFEGVAESFSGKKGRLGAGALDKRVDDQGGSELHHRGLGEIDVDLPDAIHHALNQVVVGGQALGIDDPALFAVESGKIRERPAGIHRDNVETRITDQAVKDTLRANTDQAIKRSVFGVPTFVIGPELFWGDDVMDMMIKYLNDPDLFTKGDLGRLGNIPVGIQRKESRL